MPEEVEDAPSVVLALVGPDAEVRPATHQGRAPVRGLDEDDAVGAVKDHDGRIILRDSIGLVPVDDHEPLLVEVVAHAVVEYGQAPTYSR